VTSAGKASEDMQINKEEIIRKLQRILIALLLPICGFLSSAQPVRALSVSEFFSISYSAEFSTTTISEDSPFSVTVTGSAVCIRDLTTPYNLVSEARLTGSIIAINQSTGKSLTLNPGYTLNIAPFPRTAGESTRSSTRLDLQFPSGTAPGEYAVEGRLIEGKVKAVVWLTVTGYLPSSKTLGTLTYVRKTSPEDSSGGDGAVQPAMETPGTGLPNPAAPPPETGEPQKAPAVTINQLTNLEAAALSSTSAAGPLRRPLEIQSLKKNRVPGRDGTS